MTDFPDTQHSLIARLHDAADEAAWGDFAALYQPVVYRLARSHGLQDADAHELAQETLMAVSRSVQRWQPDASLGRFRDWLRKIARNLIVNYLTRAKYKTIARGDTAAWDALQAIPSHDHSDVARAYEDEYRRELFRLAADRIKVDFQEKTWSAFWQTCVEGHAVEAVAKQLSLTTGSVYIARSRIMARLRQAIEELSK